VCEYTYLGGKLSIWEPELPHCHRVTQVAFRAVMASVQVLAVCVGWVVVHPFLCASSEFEDLLRCYCGKEGNDLYGFDES